MRLLNKGHFCRSLPGLGCLFLLIQLITHLASALCSEPPIIAGKTKMTCCETQALSIMNYLTGNTYTLAITSGGGNLSVSNWRAGKLYFDGFKSKR